MFKKSEVFAKSLKYIVLIFVVIFISYIFSGNFMYSVSQNYVNKYLSIYSNAHDLLLQKEFPLWSWNFFLGGNFLGTQSIYSIYNPFFLVTLFFSSSTLPFLFFPLLFLKIVLACGALYLYMKETKWFSKQTLAIASVVYIFNGWLLTNLNEFNTIELLVFIPLVLYGVEKLLIYHKKRYLVATFSLLLLSHFAFTVIFLPFLMGYIGIRLYAIHHDEHTSIFKDIKQLLLSLVIIIGINMMFILPMILSFNDFSIQLDGEFSLTSLLALSFQGLFPPFHETFSGRLSFVEIAMNQVSLYQSILVIMMIPQFIKMVSKRVRFITLVSYIITVIVVLFTPSIKFMNVSALTTLDWNLISILLILFNTLMIAYTLSHLDKFDFKLLKKTTYAYWFLLFVLMGITSFYEFKNIGIGFDQLTLEIILEQLIALSPYLMVLLVMILFTRVYRFVLKEEEFNESFLKYKAIFAVLMVECILVSYNYFETNSENTSNIAAYLDNENYIGNQTYAVADYLQIIDEEFYRIINRYETQYNEPLYRGYNGFSVANGSALYKKDMSWLLTHVFENGISISSDDYMITTALSAKYYFTPDYETMLPGYEYYDRIEDITIYKNNYYVPIGSRQKTYVLEDDFEQLTREQKQFLFLNSMILSAEKVEDLLKRMKLEAYDLSQLPATPNEINYYQAASSRQSNSMKDVTYSNNEVNGKVIVVEPTIMTFSIPYDKGWHAYGNGEVLKIHDINHGFIGVELPAAGTYEIKLEYRAPGYEIGFSISAITGISILACFYRYYEKKKIKKSINPSEN